jgi:hypothetical protein
VPSKTEQVNLRMDTRLKQAATKAAAADHRPLSGLIKHLLAKHCADQPDEAADVKAKPARGSR